MVLGAAEEAVEEAMRNEAEAREEHRRYEEQFELFERAYPKLKELLKRFGQPNFVPGREGGDFTVHGDYPGSPLFVVFVTSLQMLRPSVVAALQRFIKNYPDWQISMTVAIPGHSQDWPRMGLYIRPHEIIDGLQRQYFPKEFQHIEYPGARRGTADD